MQQRPPICFVGGGNMGSAIIAGLLRQDHCPPISIIDPNPAVAELYQDTPVTVSSDASTAAQAGLVVLAVKPQIAATVMQGLAPHLRHGPIVVSIMAGITLGGLRDTLPEACRLVRTMPNTPLAIGQGMVGLIADAGVSDADRTIAASLFDGSGKVLLLSDEAQMDAITAVSGSGPAYLFRFAEAQKAAAEALGFSSEQAVTLVSQTLSGSIAYLMSQEGFPAAELRQAVTSPGGTTAAGLAVFEAQDIDGLLQAVFEAAAQRSRELAG